MTKHLIRSSGFKMKAINHANTVASDIPLGYRIPESAAALSPAALSPSAR